MGNLVDGAIAKALASVQVAQARRAAFVYVLAGIPQRKQETTAVGHAISTLYALLVEQENDAFRDLFMFSLLGNDQEYVEAAKLAQEHFLSAQDDITRYVRSDAETNPWLRQTKDDFAKEIDERIALMRERAGK